MLWDGSSLIGIFVFVEGWPLFQQTLFSKIPLIGANWQKEIPAEDKPNQEKPKKSSLFIIIYLYIPTYKKTNLKTLI